MSQSVPVLDLTRLAAGDLSANQFHGVVISAAHTVNVAGDNVPIFGVLQDLPEAAGRAARVRCAGTSKVKAGAAFAAGAGLTTDANGKFVTAAAGEHRSAIASEAATAEDDIVEALLTPGGAVPA